jgi:hypothetical protein
MTDDLNLNLDMDMDFGFELDLVPAAEASEAFRKLSQGRNALDPDDVGFRVASTSKNAFFSWDAPTVETGTEKPLPEVTAADNVVALRGMIIKTRFGFSLFDNDANKMVCKTTAASYDGEVIESSMPLIRPIFQPYQSKGSDEKLHTPSRDLGRYPTMGSRGQSCEDCVLSGNHYLADADVTQGKGLCRLTGQVLMVVMAVGVSTTKNKTINGKPTQVTELTWKNVVDMTKTQYDDDDNPVEVPRFRPSNGKGQFFVVNLKLGRASIMSEVNSDRLRLDLSATPYLPMDDELYSLRDYLSELWESERFKSLKAVTQNRADKRFVYTIPTEVYLVKPTPDTKTTSIGPSSEALPVFRPAPELFGEDPQAQQRLVRIALGTYLSERALYKVTESDLPKPGALKSAGVSSERTLEASSSKGLPAPKPIEQAEPAKSAAPAPLPEANGRSKDKTLELLNNFPS